MDIETQVRLHQDAPMLSIWEHGSTDFSSREMRVTKRSHLRDKHSIHERCLLHSRIHAFKGMLVAAAPVEDYIQKIYYFFPKKIELIKNSGFDDGLLQLAIKEGKFTLLYKVCLLISEGGLNPDDPVAFFHVLIENEQQKQNLEDDFEKRSQKLTERRLGEARAFTANSRREELTYMTIGEYERFVKAGMKRRIGFLGISEVWNEIKPQLTPQLTRIIREGRCREMIENVKILQKLKTYGIVTGYDNSHLIGNLLWDVDTVAHIQEKIEAHKAVLLENWKREKKVLYSLSSMFVPKDKLEGIDREIESAIKLLDYLKKFKASFPLLAEGLEDAVILDGRAAESRLAQILKDSRVNQGVKSAASTITP